jgi:hypothetical protein
LQRREEEEKKASLQRKAADRRGVTANGKLTDEAAERRAKLKEKFVSNAAKGKPK